MRCWGHRVHRVHFGLWKRETETLRTLTEVSNGSDNQSANDSIDSNSSNSTVGTDGSDGESSSVVPSAQNESDVPALTFNMSLGNFPVTSDVDSLKVQVIATCLMFDMMFYGLLIGVLVSCSA